MFAGKGPTIENVSDDSHSIWSYGHMYTKGAPHALAKAFLDYMLSDEIRNMLPVQLGYIPATKVTATNSP